MGRKATTSKGHTDQSKKLFQKIEQLIALGLPNENIKNAIEIDYPATIEDERTRKRTCERLGCKLVDYNPTEERQLQEYIRKVRSLYNKQKAQDDALDAKFGEGTIASLDELELVKVDRLSTDNNEIDWMYDGTRIIDNATSETLYKEYGLPCGKLSLWAGERGVGKTRTAIHITGKMNEQGKKVIFFQGEVALSEFRNWTQGVIDNPKEFYVSDQVHLQDQLDMVRSVRPDIVVIDSLNMIRESKYASGMREIMTEYKHAANLTNAHIVFIGHLNKGGKVKGNNDLEYLVDVVVTIRKEEQGSSMFRLEIPYKNRYGQTGRHVEMMHTDEGVTTISTFSQQDIAIAKQAKIRHMRRTS